LIPPALTPPAAFVWAQPPLPPRGMKEDAMEKIAEAISLCLEHDDS